MNKPLIYWLIIPFVLALGTGFMLMHPPSPSAPVEPAYHGKPLSQWLSIYAGSAVYAPLPPDALTASNAISAIGTNAIPSLLYWIEHPRSRNRLQRSVAWTIFHVGFISLDTGLMRWATKEPAGTRASTVPYAFLILGTNGQAALPALEAIRRRWPQQDQGEWAMLSLRAYAIATGTDFKPRTLGAPASPKVSAGPASISLSSMPDDTNRYIH